MVSAEVGQPPGSIEGVGLVLGRTGVMVVCGGGENGIGLLIGVRAGLFEVAAAELAAGPLDVPGLD
jgi:hypothetical protein